MKAVTHGNRLPFVEVGLPGPLVGEKRLLIPAVRLVP